jgi:hypothetical protein
MKPCGRDPARYIHVRSQLKVPLPSSLLFPDLIVKPDLRAEYRTSDALHVMSMALLHAGRGDLDELGRFLQGFNCLCASVTQPGP